MPGLAETEAGHAGNCGLKRMAGIRQAVQLNPGQNGIQIKMTGWNVASRK
jgi:hypothetical protein